MFPIDVDTPRPVIPHAERIFAASRELHEAYARGEEWTKAMPLHEAYVFFFLEVTNDAIGDMIRRWDEAGRPGPFPDALAVQDELRRIICLEDSQAAATTGTPEAAL